jgi:lipopolysaccharide export system permease protein
MTLVGVPWGNVSLEKLALEVLSSNVDIGLKERTFNDSFENVMLYVNKIDIKDKKIIDIFIEDKRQAEMVSTVVAPEGRLISDPEKSAIHLQLYNGTIHQTNLKNRSVNSISFDTYLLNFELDRKVVKFEDKKKDADEMGLAELREYIKKSKTRDKDYWKAQIVFHRKFAYPIACFALALSAMPLGIQSGSVKRSFGLALGLFFFFLYYMLLSIAIILGESGKLHPAIGMYLPIAITGFIGLYLFNNTAKERTILLVLLFQHIRKLALKFRRI